MSSPEYLTRRFLAHVADAELRAACAGDLSLADRLVAMIDSARSRWPAITLDSECFVTHVASKIRADDDVARLHTDDLYLACACARGDDAAVGLLIEAFGVFACASLCRLGLPPHAREEVWQRALSATCCAKPDGPPGIANYRGRSPLRSWLRSVTVRQGVRAITRDAPNEILTADSAVIESAGTTDDLELLVLKRRYQVEFRCAFNAAVHRLTDRERNLLAQHHLDGLSVDELGRLHHVHRATAARWVAAARQQLASLTRQELSGRLDIHGVEAASLIRWVQSQLDVSMHELHQARR